MIFGVGRLGMFVHVRASLCRHVATDDLCFQVSRMGPLRAERKGRDLRGPIQASFTGGFLEERRVYPIW